jgi:hypothetical protein
VSKGVELITVVLGAIVREPTPSIDKIALLNMASSSAQSGDLASRLEEMDISTPGEKIQFGSLVN